MCLCVHDEIVFEIKTDYMDVIIPKLKEIMCMKLPDWPFALGVDIEVGDNWGDIRDWVPGMFENSGKAGTIDIVPKNNMVHLKILENDEKVFKDIRAYITTCITNTSDGMGITLDVEGNEFYLSKIKINKDKFTSLLEERLTPEQYHISLT